MYPKEKLVSVLVEYESRTLWLFVWLKFARVRVPVLPVVSGPCRVHVPDGGQKVLKDPGMVDVPDVVFLTDTADRGSNVGVPGGRHAGEQVVFHLEIKATGEVAGNGSTVRARGFHLRLEPTDLAIVVSFRFLRRITIRVFKVVGQTKERGQGERFGNPENENVGQRPEADPVKLEGTHHVNVNVEQSQRNGVLAATAHKVTFHANAHRKRPALSQIQNLRIEDGTQPVSGQNRQIKECLEPMVPLPGRVSSGIIVEEHHGFRTEAVGVHGRVIGVGVVRPVLFDPQPLASTDKVGPESEQVIDEGVLF